MYNYIYSHIRYNAIISIIADNKKIADAIFKEIVGKNKNFWDFIERIKN
jgi:hypothetical protein